MTQAKILIVEDDIMVMKELVRCVSESGHEVVGKVTTGEEAVRKAKETQPDLILMDIKLEGEMDGIETSTLIRSFTDTAIVYLTAHTATDVFERAKLTEPHAYLTKPVSPQELGRAVEMALYNRKIEKQLKESEARYRNLFENMSNAVAIYRAVEEGNDFVFADFNAAAEQIERTKRDSLIGRSVLEVFPGVKDFGLFDVFRRVWHTGEPEHYPTTLYKDDRITGWRNNFVYKLPSGEIVAVYSDETARALAEQALAAEKERLAVTLRSIGDAVISTDTDGRIMFLNEVAERLTGWIEKEALGKQIDEVFHTINEHTRRRSNNPVEEVLRTGEIVGLASDTILIGKDGTERILGQRSTHYRQRRHNCRCGVGISGCYTREGNRRSAQRK